MRLRQIPVGWWLDAGLLTGFGAVTLALNLAVVRDLDRRLRDWSDAHRPAAGQLLARGVNLLGQGGLLTTVAALLALWLCWRRRSAWLLVPVVTAFLLVGLAIQPLKLWLHRAAPHAQLHGDEVRLFSQPGGLSYPSGHAVNSVVWYGILALLLAPWLTGRARRWFRLAPPVLVTLASTYLGYHWLSDMLAGLCLGVLVDRVLSRIGWPDLPAAPDPHGAGARPG
jgi:membrane-associated phospholipid phosphatase